MSADHNIQNGLLWAQIKQTDNFNLSTMKILGTIQINCSRTFESENLHELYHQKKRPWSEYYPFILKGIGGSWSKASRKWSSGDFKWEMLRCLEDLKSRSHKSVEFVEAIEFSEGLKSLRPKIDLIRWSARVTRHQIYHSRSFTSWVLKWETLQGLKCPKSQSLEAPEENLSHQLVEVMCLQILCYG
jgi:hypothetical protein